MIRLHGAVKRDPARRWALPDRAFFAAGACHVLAHAFLERHGTLAMRALWIRPAPGFTMNHIVVDGGAWVFDWRGYAPRDRLLAHHRAKARRWWPDWEATLVELPRDVLVSEERSRTHAGLWLREPRQFLHDAAPRARAYLDRFPPPPGPASLR